MDSAWTRENRGAVVSLITEDGKSQLDGPHTVSFDEALAHIQLANRGAELHALAIDQPLIVKNATRRRPVEDVVSHVMGKHGSAVQPANRSKQTMFGDGAPIWPFLTALEDMGFSHDHRANDRAEARGSFFFEVYPALSNLGLFWPFYTRGMVPRYNPQRRTFDPNDWQLLCSHVLSFVERWNVECDWLKRAMPLVSPSKREQDKLDAIICLCIAMSWTSGECGVVIGDFETGYIVVPSHNALTELYRKHSAVHRVPFWPQTVLQGIT
jgi:predicted RNase H-like nuclease